MPLSYRVKQDLILSAYLKQTGAPRWSVGVTEMFDGTVVFEDWDSGKKLQCSYTIDEESLAVTLGAAEAVIEVPTFQTAPFSADALFSGEVRFSEGGWVTRTGMLFRAGDYPDKGAKITTADLQTAVDNFSSAPVDIEHRPSLFDGRLGSVERVWLSGEELWGEVAVPKWLDDSLKGVKKKVSCTFMMTPFRLIGLALTTAPRVADAALVEASTARGTKVDINPQTQPKQTWLARLRELLTSPDAQIAFSEENPAPVPTNNPPAPVAVPVDSNVIALRAEIERIHMQGDSAAAVAFADTLAARGAIVPAQKGAIMAMYAAAAADDRQNSREIQFTVGEQSSTGSRLDVLRAFASSLPDQQILGERMDVARTSEAIRRAAEAGGAPKQEGPSEAEVAAFMSQSSLGVGILEARRQESMKRGGQ